MTDLNLHSDHSLTITGHFNNNGNSKDITFESNDALTVNGTLKLLGESRVFVGTSATIEHDLILNGSCKVCINGDLSARSIQINGNAELWVNGKINGAKSGISTKEYLKKCGTSPDTPKQLPYSWKDQITKNIDYQF